MAINNKILELNANKEFYVPVVQRNGVNKYIDKNYYSCKSVNCTIKINKAKRFISGEAALKFYNDMKSIDKSLKLVAIATLKINYFIDRFGDI